MPSLAEVRAQLTGPGGMFEVVTEDVAGRPLQVYAQRMRSLREIARGAAARGGDKLLAYGDREYGFRGLVAEADGLGHLVATKCGLEPAEQVGALAQNTPERCLSLVCTWS